MDHSVSELHQIIGKRMREARVLNNLTQEHAARLMGFETSSYLSKIERSTCPPVSIHKIVVAANIYDVSVDYLTGLTDDWDSDIEEKQAKQIARHALSGITKDLAYQFNTIHSISEKVRAMEAVVVDIVNRSDGISQAMAVFIKGHPSIASNKLFGALALKISGLILGSTAAKNKLKRAKVDIGIID